MSGTYDVTVRIPVGFESAMEAAGFIERAVVQAMEEKGWTGGCAVIARDEHGFLKMFEDGKTRPPGGFIDEGFRLPHDLGEEGVPALAQALRWTAEATNLPAKEGYAWFDALSKWAPRFLAGYHQPDRGGTDGAEAE
jgi:hypothetical protein